MFIKSQVLKHRNWVFITLTSLLRFLNITGSNLKTRNYIGYYNDYIFGRYSFKNRTSFRIKNER